MVPDEQNIIAPEIGLYQSASPIILFTQQTKPGKLFHNLISNYMVYPCFLASPVIDISPNSATMLRTLMVRLEDNISYSSILLLLGYKEGAVCQLLKMNRDIHRSRREVKMKMGCLHLIFYA